MHRTNRVPRALVWGVLLGLQLCGLDGAMLSAQPPLPPPPPGGPPAVAPGGVVPAAPGSPVPSVIIPINGTQRLQMTNKKRIARVVNQKDTVCRVSPVIDDPTSVIITGLEPGISRVAFTDVDGHTEAVDVVVQFDVEYLRSLLRRTVPTASVEPIPAANNTIILTGNVAHAEDIDIILRTTQSIVLGPDRVINAMRVGGVQQVQLCVVVARVSRTKVRDMAFSFFENGAHHFIGSTVGGAGAAAANSLITVPTVAGNLSQSANLVLGLVNDEQAFFGFLQALKTEGVAKILAEPRLMALSGRSASFLDGGEQAVPVPAGLGQIGVQFEEFGTRLNFLPIVLGNGKIHLEVEPEVSNLDAAAGVSIQGTVVPGRSTQRVHTTVELEDGQTFVIGGLIQHTSGAKATKVPILGEIPIIGAAFSAKHYEEEEHELVVMVTPHLVDAMSCDQLPHYLPGMETRTPDDCELFLEGILEAPRGPREICPDYHYVPAWKNGPTAGQFPCAGGCCGRTAGCSGSCLGGSCLGGSCDGSIADHAILPVSATVKTGNDVVPASFKETSPGSTSSVVPAGGTQPSAPASQPTAPAETNGQR